MYPYATSKIGTQYTSKPQTIFPFDSSQISPSWTIGRRPQPVFDTHTNRSISMPPEEYSTDSSTVPSMVYHPPCHGDTAGRLVTAHRSSSLGYGDVPASYWQQRSNNDPSTSNHSGSYYSSPNTPSTNLLEQNYPAHCALSPLQTSHHSSTNGQTPRHPFPTLGCDSRDNRNVSASAHSQSHLSSELLQSPRWSTATNVGSGVSLSSPSRLEGNVPGRESISSSRADFYNTESYARYRDAANHDEESDAMSDGIASDEGVYSSSGSDRDVFDDEDDDDNSSDGESETSSSSSY